MKKIILITGVLVSLNINCAAMIARTLAGQRAFAQPNRSTRTFNINLLTTDEMLKLGTWLKSHDFNDPCSKHERYDDSPLSGPRPPYEIFDTPIHTATNEMDHEILEILLKGGVDPDTCNNVNHTPLLTIFSYFQNDDPKVLQAICLLLDYNANPNARTLSNNTALHLAAGSLEDSKKVIKLLISRGASLCLANDNNKLPLDVAIMKKKTYGNEWTNDPEVFELLSGQKGPQRADE